MELVFSKPDDVCKRRVARGLVAGELWYKWDCDFIVIRFFSLLGRAVLMLGMTPVYEIADYETLREVILSRAKGCETPDDYAEALHDWLTFEFSVNPIFRAQYNDIQRRWRLRK